MADELGDEPGCGSRVERVWVRVLVHAPVVHHRDDVSDRQRLFLIVGDEDRRGAGLVQDGPDVLAHALAQRRVEVREGFVEQDEVGTRGQCPCQGDTLLLAPGQSRRQSVRLTAHADQVECLPDPSAALGPVDAPHAVPDVVRHAEVGEEGVVLEHQCHAASLGGHERAWPGDLAPVDHDRAGIGSVEPSDEAKRGRLAAARGPEQGHQIATRHV